MVKFARRMKTVCKCTLYIHNLAVLADKEVSVIQLVEQCKVFHMNELEVALWSFYVDAFVCGSCGLPDFLQFTAFEAKVAEDRNRR